MAPQLAATVVVLERGRVLLATREDFQVWAVPGGMVDPGESVAEAAVRELREETGLDVDLDGFVGIYSRLGGMPDIHTCVFVGHIVGGDLRAQPGETVALDWFDPGRLPADFLWWHGEYVRDAMTFDGQAVARTIRVEARLEVASREELYRERDASGMGRAEFFRWCFPAPVPGRAGR